MKKFTFIILLIALFGSFSVSFAEEQELGWVQFVVTPQEGVAIEETRPIILYISSDTDIYSVNVFKQNDFMARMQLPLNTEFIIMSAVVEGDYRSEYLVSVDTFFTLTDKNLAKKIDINLLSGPGITSDNSSKLPEPYVYEVEKIEEGKEEIQSESNHQNNNNTVIDTQSSTTTMIIRYVLLGSFAFIALVIVGFFIYAGYMRNREDS